MHGLRHLPHIGVSILTLVALTSSARADFFLHHWEIRREAARTLSLGVQASYYSTTENYDGVGDLLIPAGFEKYSRIQSDLLAVYGLLPRLSAYARLGWARVQLDHVTLAGSSFGLTDGTAGLNVRAFEIPSSSLPAPIAVDVQAQADFPLYTNPPAGQRTGPLLGDGTVDLTGGAFVTIPMAANRSGELSFVGGAGYTHRNGGFSSAVPWSVTVRYVPVPGSEGLFASVAGLGVQSLKTDPLAAGLNVSNTSNSAGTGGSFVTGAVNPSLITVRGTFGYQFASDLEIGLNVSKTAWGQASPSALQMGLGLTARLGGDGKGSGPGSAYKHANEGFINYALEARVTRTNDRLNLVKIDKGKQEGVAVGQVFDIFGPGKGGASGGEAIARGKVTSVLSNESALTIEEYFKEVWIDEGFVARRPVE